MTSAFFPNEAFGWVFLACLAAIMAVASYLDLRSTIIPKWLTLSAVPIAIIFNMVRVAWLAHLGKETWLITTESPTLGAIDGLLFTLAGFVFGFAMFLILWILGVCGGGDVKLFAALGAWIGTMLAVKVMVATLFVLLILILGQAATFALSGNWRQLRKRSPKAGAKPGRRLVTFALPLTIATFLVLAWSFRFELGFVPPKQAIAQVHGEHHAT